MRFVQAPGLLFIPSCTWYHRTSETMPKITPKLIDLSSPVLAVSRVGSRVAAHLKRLGIVTVKDLLRHLPSRHEDFTQAVPIADIEPGSTVSIQGEIITIANRFIWPRRLTITTATIGDSSGAIRAVWFNQPYLEEALPTGVRVSIAGSAKLDKRGLYLASPQYEKIGDGSGNLRHTGRLIPIYPETHGITSKLLRFLIQPLLETVSIADPLPAAIRKQFGLSELGNAVRTVHYPARVEDIPAAKARLAFDDLLLLQIKALVERRKIAAVASVRIPFDETYIRTVVASLPFGLTKDQRIAAFEILKDIERPYPMNRLLEGDVGSGKTVVAFLAAAQTVRTGHQTAILAPTEVLANQHEQTLLALGSKLGIPVILLTGSETRINGVSVTKQTAKQRIVRGQACIVVGTHAVIQKDVRFGKLALVVIDEQHRFGVQQRAALLKPERSRNAVTMPHLLSMTATPIPRTLALTIFGDLDISLLREKPANRFPVMTHVVTADGREATYTQIRREVARGRQVFVICPAIEVSDRALEGTGAQLRMSELWAQVKAVQDEYKRLTADVFPDLRIAMLHGKMKSKDKNAVMEKFRSCRFDILVSTSVIEVGVDVPNASIMVVESADRFGLAQLHQFRGRVGRDDYQSHCFLFPTDDATASERLRIMAEVDDGFSLAEHDMRLRGPGEFFGLKQSGLPDLTMAALADMELIKKARQAARLILREDPSLKNNPLLKQRLATLHSLVHRE